MGLGHDLSCSKVSQAFASIFGGSYILGLGLGLGLVLGVELGLVLEIMK